MSEYRAGESRIIAPASAKESMGRASFIRPGNHQGQMSNQTEWLASKRLAGIGSKEGPNEAEIKIVFESNPEAVRTYKSAGMTKLEIYEALKDL